MERMMTQREFKDMCFLLECKALKNKLMAIEKLLLIEGVLEYAKDDCQQTDGRTIESTNISAAQ